MFDLTFLTPQDVKILNEKADFTADQAIILDHLRKNDLTDEGIMKELSMSRSKYYSVKNNLFIKIVHAAVQSTD